MSEPSQLELLARPFPPKYVKAPAAGKYGSYVPHDVVTQALLMIVGPYDLDVGQILYGDDHKVEGCLITLTLTVDGQRVSVTEVGDCEQPSNWKTQGARMKDAISDGVKRCAMRLGLGLHLWAQEDYFLYAFLSKTHGVVPVRPEVSPPAGSEQSEGTGSPPAVLPVPSVLSDANPIPDAPAVSKLRRDNAMARVSALLAEKVSVASRRESEGLPPLDKKVTAVQMDGWELLLTTMEAELEASKAPVR